jgi:transcription initiation factor IIE alpha subunit
MINVFECESYRLWLAKLVYHADSERGIQSRLAEAAECQKSYLSLVLQEKVHLSQDQLLKITRYLRLQDTETDFIMELHSLERAGSKELRERLSQKLKNIRRIHEALDSRLATEIRGEKIDDAIYHSAWYYGAIHLLVSIPNFRTSEKIAEHLQLDKNLVKKILADLKQMGFIEESKGNFSITKKNIHLPRSSPLFAMSHAAWRLQAMNEVQSGALDSLHYTSLHTMSFADYIRFKELLLEFIDKSRRLVAPSKDETLACVALDFFEVK